MNSMKDVNYYMNLPYRVELEPIPEEEGGGFSACVPQLGRYAFRADGETIAEALEKLEGIKREYFAAYLRDGVPIPEPEKDEEDYSGKFVLRIPKYLHRELSMRAKENNVSLNQFVSSLLAAGLAMDKFTPVADPVRYRTPRTVRDKSRLRRAE